VDVARPRLLLGFFFLFLGRLVVPAFFRAFGLFVGRLRLVVRGSLVAA
jgi:hypothetical protein